jgi:hypothetical protein
VAVQHFLFLPLLLLLKMLQVQVVQLVMAVQVAGSDSHPVLPPEAGPVSLAVCYCHP